MAKYGNMLAAFPELMEEFEVFNMKPRGGAGYGPRTNIRKVVGYWSWRKMSELEVQADLRAPHYHATFWARDDFITGRSVIKQGDYVAVKDDIFIVIDDQNFSREGAFTRCLVRRLVGPTDQQVSNRDVDEAVISDY